MRFPIVVTSVTAVMYSVEMASEDEAIHSDVCAVLAYPDDWMDPESAPLVQSHGLRPRYSKVLFPHQQECRQCQ